MRPLSRRCRPSPGRPGFARPCASCPAARPVGAALTRPLHQGRAPTVPCRPRRGAGVPLGFSARLRTARQLRISPARFFRAMWLRSPRRASVAVLSRSSVLCPLAYRKAIADQPGPFFEGSVAPFT
ncbi:hypothetical protein IHE45_20G017000 [Dioscorea alata]|uniref:Uncharacterized protein n=2 Tax=Dioscorea alata TaxID=55571 RepID=A0ACB7TT11_DIOAL|nr:hypothetical protein IHE45_20G016700 [Dioscorea alata]KAH7650827.1 hypothetical protein IHE45_20G017000 [Dioscorea alata]